MAFMSLCDAHITLTASEFSCLTHLVGLQPRQLANMEVMETNTPAAIAASFRAHLHSMTFNDSLMTLMQAAARCPPPGTLRKEASTAVIEIEATVVEVIVESLGLVDDDSPSCWLDIQDGRVHKSSLVRETFERGRMSPDPIIIGRVAGASSAEPLEDDTDFMELGATIVAGMLHRGISTAPAITRQHQVNITNSDKTPAGILSITDVVRMVPIDLARAGTGEQQWVWDSPVPDANRSRSSSPPRRVEPLRPLLTFMFTGDGLSNLKLRLEDVGEAETSHAAAVAIIPMPKVSHTHVLDLRTVRWYPYMDTDTAAAFAEVPSPESMAKNDWQCKICHAVISPGHKKEHVGAHFIARRMPPTVCGSCAVNGCTAQLLRVSTAKSLETDVASGYFSRPMKLTA